MRLLARLIPTLLLVVPAVLPAQAPAIPTPAAVFGFEPGADFKLANYDQVVEYFQTGRRRERSRDARAGRQVDAGPDVLLRARVVAREPRATSIAIVKSRGGWRIRTA